ncbi:hypothetical protein GIB67_001665 [Kingdonia uniflora]|uniref:Uncharacterized protein n=1 Tax=Kingdonia uniflora TaxID=39325 RepID=A0A7J7M440_9MAGN|nr:hypothetical protein GIB67_001665 [Kingdonia uniflora]
MEDVSIITVTTTFQSYSNALTDHQRYWDIWQTFGLVESSVSIVTPTDWHPVPDQFPPKREMEEWLIHAGKKKRPYVRRKNLTKALKHMVAESESESEEGSEEPETEVAPAAFRPAAATTVPAVSTTASTGSAPHDFASLYTYMES